MSGTIKVTTICAEVRDINDLKDLTGNVLRKRFHAELSEEDLSKAICSGTVNVPFESERERLGSFAFNGYEGTTQEIFCSVERPLAKHGLQDKLMRYGWRAGHLEAPWEDTADDTNGTARVETHHLPRLEQEWV